mgnify:CR=1 FL=1
MALGLQPQVVPSAPNEVTIEFAEYEDDIDLGEDDVPETGSKLKMPTATKRVLVTLYDWFGDERFVHRGARSYYLSKKRVDPATGKLRRVFTERPPKAFIDPETGLRKEKVESVDYLVCPVCWHKCELDRRQRVMKLTDEQRSFSLRVAKDRHVFGFHPEDYIYYFDPEIRDRTETIAAGGKRKK